MSREELQKKAEQWGKEYPLTPDRQYTASDIQAIAGNSYLQGYDDARKEFGWHPYPAEKPEEECMCFVIFHDEPWKFVRKSWYRKDYGFLFDKCIIAWMQIPDEEKING